MLWRDVRAVEGARLESVYTFNDVSRVRIPLSPVIIYKHCSSVFVNDHKNDGMRTRRVRQNGRIAVLHARSLRARRVSARDGASESLYDSSAASIGPFATISCEPRQVRKEATVTTDASAEVGLVLAADGF